MLDLQSVIKYVLEGLAVAVAAYFIPRKTVDIKEIAIIALTAAATFAILDQFAPGVAMGARQGSGFGIGYNITTGLEGFEDEKEKDKKDKKESHEHDDSSTETESTDSFTDGKVPEAGDDGERYASIM